MGSFYPGDISPRNFSAHYARTFRTVEIDATWHFMPNPKTVPAWERKVPDDFVFAAKVPKVITHEKLLKNCEDDWSYFLETMGTAGPQARPASLPVPVLWQSATTRTSTRPGRSSPADWRPSCPCCPRSTATSSRCAIPSGSEPELTELLRSRNIALALIDHCRMPRPARWFEMCDPITADFSYVRFLGDHHAMDELVAHKRETGEIGRLGRAGRRPLGGDARVGPPARRLTGRVRMSTPTSTTTTRASRRAPSSSS